MTNSFPEKWGLDELLDKYPFLSLLPEKNGGLTISGRILESVVVPDGKRYDLDYRISMEVLQSFPSTYPFVKEVDGKIPDDFHKLRRGHLCLGSPLRLQLITSKGKSLTAFVENVVLPYLAGHAADSLGDPMPFDELDHGEYALLEDYAELFKLPTSVSAYQMLNLLTKSARFAKNQPCPCGSSKKMRHCHQKIIAPMRKHLSSSDFRKALKRVEDELERVKKLED